MILVGEPSKTSEIAALCWEQGRRRSPYVAACRHMSLCDTASCNNAGRETMFCIRNPQSRWRIERTKRPRL